MLTFEKGSPSAGVTVHPDPFNEAVCKNVRIRRRIQPDDFLEFFPAVDGTCSCQVIISNFAV